MKKFVEKLKNLFKNKKLCTWLMASVLALTTLGTGIGLVIHNNVNWGGVLSQIENPQNENDTHSMASGYWSDTSYQANFSGGGTATNPYLIENAAQLARAASLVNSTSSYRNKQYRLTKDIDISAHYWVPFSNNGTSNSFTGVFDGDGHTIKGLTIDATTSTIQNYATSTSSCHLGLFGYATNAIIRNIFFQNANVSKTAEMGARVGIVAGRLSSNEISNCHILNGSIVFSDSQRRSNNECGGIVGRASSASISNCSVVASMEVYNAEGCGGICGHIGAGSIYDSYYSKSNNDVIIKNTNYAGLIVGEIINSHIYRCYSDSTGADVGSVSNFGGIVGYITGGGEIISCFGRNGYFTSKPTYYFGALAAQIASGSIVSCTFEMFSDVDGTMGCGMYAYGGYDNTDSNRYYVAATTPLEPSFYTGTTWLGRGNGTPWDLDGVWFLDNSLPISSRKLPVLRSQSPDVTFDFNMGDTSTTRSVNYFNANNIENITPNCTNFVKANGKNQRTTISFSDSNSAGYNAIAVWLCKTNNTVERRILDSSIRTGDFNVSFQLTSEYKYLQIRFNGSQNDGAIYYNLNDLIDGTYTLRFTVSEVNRNGNNTFTNFCITEGNNTSLNSLITGNSETVMHTNSISYVPTVSRTGYTFDGWYKKKNYLDENVMDDFMAWINAQETSHSETDALMQKSGNVYSWWGATAGYGGSSGFVYYDYHTGIYLTGTYRLSYYAYCPDPEIASKTSTCLQSNNIGMDRVNSTSWQYYSGQGTFNNEEVLLGLTYNYGQQSYFKNIRLERIDADDFEGEAYVAGSSLSFGSSDKATLYAKWTEITYTLTVNFDSTTSWTNAPTSVKVEVYDKASYKISKGEKWTYTLGYNSFSSTKDIRATVWGSSNDYSYYVSFNSKPTTSSSIDTTATTWSARTNLTVTLYVYQRYTISFDKGCADDGTVPSSIYKIHGTNVTLPTNTMTKKGYKANGWNEAIDGSGKSWKDKESVSSNQDATLYPNFEADIANVDTVINEIDNDNEIYTNGYACGAAQVTYWKDVNKTPVQVTEECGVFYPLVGYEYTIVVPLIYDVYGDGAEWVFVGFSDGAFQFPPPSKEQPNNVYTGVATDVATGNGWEDVWICYKRKAYFEIQWTAEDGGYWYFESGIFPQNEVKDQSVLAELNSISSSTRYDAFFFLIGEQELEEDVYIYCVDEKYYAYAEYGEIGKWFSCDPIRWRVSPHGTAQDEYPEGFENYGDIVTNPIPFCSDKILCASAMDYDGAGWSGYGIYDSTLLRTCLQALIFGNYYDIFNMEVSGTFLPYMQYFSEPGTQEVVTEEELDYGWNSYDCVLPYDTLEDPLARLTDFASFLMFGTTSFSGQYGDYWTMNLKDSNGRSEYECGVVITRYGTESLRWLTGVSGVRMCCSFNPLQRL